MSLDQVGRAGAIVLTSAAVVLPTLVVHWVIVGYAVFAQLISVILWGAALALWGLTDRVTRTPWSALRPVWLAVAALTFGVAASWWRIDSAGTGPIVCALGLLVTAGVTAASAARLGSGQCAAPALVGLLIGLIVAAAVNSLIGIVQVFVPAAADGFWLASLPSHTRATGNLIHPNMLATLCVLALAGVVTAHLTGWLGKTSWWLAAFLFPASIGLTASRVGLLELALLAGWALFDRSLPRRVRYGLLASPWVCGVVVYAAQFVMTALSGEVSEMSRATLRVDIYRGAWALIREQPWLGVGWDELGTAWALSPAVDSLGRSFDHVHNLPLQLAAELGVPLAGVVVIGLCWAFAAAWRRCRGTPHVGLVMMLLAVAAHSMVEFPLWFAYFLLPTAWALGLAVGSGQPAAAAPATERTALWVPAGLAVSLGAFLVFADFARALPVALPPAHPTPLQVRLSQARTSQLFAHQVDAVAAVALTQPPLEVFTQGRHATIDRCMLVAWSKALARVNRLDEARHVAQRARTHPFWGLGPWVEGCQDRGLVGLPVGDPDHPVDWRSLRR